MANIGFIVGGGVRDKKKGRVIMISKRNIRLSLSPDPLA